MIWKILFCGQIFEMAILINLHDSKSPESENHMFRVGWFVCACVKTNYSTKINYSRNFTVGILHLYPIEKATWTVYETQTNKHYAGEHKIIIKHYSQRVEFLVRTFQYICTELNMMK